jgi:hypothetical protein
MHFPKESFFFPKRAVFDKGGPEGQKGEEPAKKTAEQVATDAKEAAIKDALAKEGDVGDIKKDAETKVDATDAETKIKDDAKKKLDLHKAEFEQAKEYIAARTAAKAVLKEFEGKDNNWQFENMDRLEKARQELAKNKLSEKDKDFLTALDTKIADIQKNAESYYGGINEKAGEQVTVLTQSPDMKGITEAMDILAKLQACKVSKYKGLPADKASAMAKITDTNITNLMKAVEDAQGKLPDADKENFKTLYGDAFKMAKTADSNFNASRNGDTGWKAGAEEYLAMSVSQGKAIAARESIPKSDKFADNFYVKNAGELDQWNQEKWGPTIAIYKQALKDFEEAKKLSANTKAGDSTKAKDLFDKARNGFLAVKAAADTYAADQKQEEEKKAKEKEKNKAEASKKDAQAAWDKIPDNKVLKDYARKLGGAGGDVNGHWGKGEQLLKEEKFAEAKTAFEESKQGYEKAMADYGKMLTAAMTEVNRGIDNVMGYQGTTAQYENTIADYLSNPAIYGNDEALGKVFQSMVVENKFAKNGYTYTVKAGFPEGGGRAKVTISVEQGGFGGDYKPEARLGKSKEEMTTEMASRIEAARDHHATVDSNASDFTFQTAERNFLNDTLSRMSPTEIDQIVDQPFPVKYTAGGVEKTSYIVIKKDQYRSGKYIPTFSANPPAAPVNAEGGTPVA